MILPTGQSHAGLFGAIIIVIVDAHSVEDSIYLVLQL
jgi:hypothetical protein